MNRDLILARTAVVKAIRRFFDERGFTEMLTPRLIGLPGQEPYLEPFWTEVVRQDDSAHVPAALITSPEYAMKKLLSAGFDKIYDLGSCFRNEEPWDGSHDPEFLLLEWYRRDAGLEELLRDTEDMIRYVSRNTQHVAHILPEAPFRRLTVAQAMKQYANLDLDTLLDNREAMADAARAHGQTVTESDTWDDLFFKIFLSEVEPKLGWSSPSPSDLSRSEHREGEGRREVVPTFLTHYPASMAALARRDEKDPRYALRTELYIGDLELANGFAELADPVEQRKRFEEEQALRSRLGKKTWPIDERFIEALPGMGNAAGIAFGVDRLVMLLTGTSSISDLMPIPVRERF
ncbi:MAG: amino acid--tRNA ligase-related protein [Patescibacteria group bacterium]